MKSLNLALVAGLLSLSAHAAQAAIVKPADAAVPVSPPFGAVVPGGLVTNQYNPFGVNFSTPAAVFSDPPLAWSGVNASNIVDLLTAMNVFFTLPNSLTDAVTNQLSVEAGNSAVGNLLLEAFDINGALLGSTINDDGIGPAGRTLATLNIPGMHSFRISTPARDSFGMNQIEFGDLVPVGQVPVPATLALALFGLVALRRAKKA